jgi:ribosomal protein S18 acetylase RimI-like enzyme
MSNRDAPAGNDALVARHLRIGYVGLLVFLTLGVVLEALHGFKVGLYLDVGNEARRLSLRLAHAHGALLSVLHVVFALTLGSRAAPPRDTAERAGRFLSAALLLLPGGFLLGGLFVNGGDPGVGVLLVPVGALCLFVAVLLTARAIGRGGVLLREMAWDSPNYDASVALRSRVLRQPLGLYPGPEERPAEAKLRHLGAFDGDRLVGCLMLEDKGDGRVKMRQVAVDFEHQRRGIGSKLVAFSERVAREAGFREMVLNARDTAVPFYERNGYAKHGEPFVEVTVRHYAMSKSLAPAAGGGKNRA